MKLLIKPYIAESRRLELFDKLKQAKFFSLLIDGSTDKGNADDEVFMAVWCDGKSSDEKVHTRTAYLHVERPKTVDACGLFLAVKNALLRYLTWILRTVRSLLESEVTERQRISLEGDLKG